MNHEIISTIISSTYCYNVLILCYKISLIIIEQMNVVNSNVRQRRWRAVTDRGRAYGSRGCAKSTTLTCVCIKLANLIFISHWFIAPVSIVDSWQCVLCVLVSNDTNTCTAALVIARTRNHGRSLSFGSRLFLRGFFVHY